MDICIEYANQVGVFAASVGFLLGLLVMGLINLAVSKQRSND